MFLNYIPFPFGPPLALGLTVTKVVFEYYIKFVFLLYLQRLTVTKVVFEYGWACQFFNFYRWLTVTKVVFECLTSSEVKGDGKD